ncbi:MAG: PEGA domain-containing protein, partial [Candidatus Falkowbacteria bacterium]|nr:PEGA domain-containing protein [Candidatus Falkowbacteria bacterium]
FGGNKEKVKHFIDLFDENIIIKTGLINIKSDPSNAEVLLNGEKQYNFLQKYLNKNKSNLQTPAVITNLLPKEYAITLKKENYWDWNRVVNLKANEAINIGEIILFKKQLPESVINEEIISVLESPNNTKALIQTENNRYIYNYANGNILKLEYYAPDSNVAWSPEEDTIIVNNSIIDSETGVQILKIADEQKTKKIFWLDQYSVIQITDKDYRNININTKEIKIIKTSDNFADYSIKNARINKDKLYLILLSKNGLTELNILNIDTLENIISIKFNDQGEYQILSFAKNNLYILNKFKKQISTLDLNSLIFKENKIKNFSNIEVLNKDTLLLYNDQEIWEYSISEDSIRRIVKTKDRIEQVKAYEKKNYVFYSTEVGIYAIELLDKDKLKVKGNIIKLTSLKNINHLTFFEKDETIFFSAKSTQKNSYYKLSL